MNSQLPRSDSPKADVDAKIWDMIFLDTKIKAKKSKKATVTAEPSNPITAADIDIRDWPSRDRQMLVSKGNRVDIFIGDEPVTTISKPLLRATSVTAGVMLKNGAGAIKLPADTDRNGVILIVNYLEDIIKADARSGLFLRSSSMATSLSACAAAFLLGMDKYTVHVYRKCEALLRMDPPTYKDIDAILVFRKVHWRLFKIVVEGLAVHVWEGTIPDPEDFAVYLAQNPVLDNAIKARISKNEYELRKRQGLEKRRIQQAEAQARHEALVKEKTEREKRNEAEKKAFFAAKAAKEAALEKSVQLKMRASEPKARKFTAEETAHYWRRYGKKPPKGC
jgi:hypothetical protein